MYSLFLIVSFDMNSVDKRVTTPTAAQSSALAPPCDDRRLEALPLVVLVITAVYFAAHLFRHANKTLARPPTPPVVAV